LHKPCPRSRSSPLRSTDRAGRYRCGARLSGWACEWNPGRGLGWSFVRPVGGQWTTRDRVGQSSHDFVFVGCNQWCMMISTQHSATPHTVIIIMEARDLRMSAIDKGSASDLAPCFSFGWPSAFAFCTYGTKYSNIPIQASYMSRRFEPGSRQQAARYSHTRTKYGSISDGGTSGWSPFTKACRL